MGIGKGGTGYRGRSAAHAWLTRLGQQYIHECRLQKRGWSIPWSVDRFAFASLLVCHEHGDGLEAAAKDIVRACKSEVATVSGWPHLDTFVWECCEDLIVSRCLSPVHTDALVAKMTHHKSDIRCHFLKLAWLIRDLLPAEEALPLLLNDVESTLGGWRLSLGLAMALHGGGVDTFASWALQEFSEIISEQFEKRIEALKTHGESMVLYDFHAIELNLRALLQHLAAELPVQIPE